MSKDYLGGLAITPDGLYTLAAAADGVLSLLDMRKAGARLSYASCSAPLRCLQTDGRYAVVGLENGQVLPPHDSISISWKCSRVAARPLC